MNSHDVIDAGNDPAFPHERHCSERGNRWTETVEGLTKREWFAGMALQGYMANAHISTLPTCGTSDAAATAAVQSADALIAELIKDPT